MLITYFSEPSLPIIGLDLAKKVFQVHGVDAAGKVVVACKLRRKEMLAFFAKLPPFFVGNAHRSAREFVSIRRPGPLNGR
jgi:transposase